MNLILNSDHIRAVAPGHPDPDAVVAALRPVLQRYEIDQTPERLGMFLATLAHESNFVCQSERLGYSAQRLAEVWPNRYASRPGVPNALALRLAAAGPQAIANNCYAARMGNGPESSGDGWRYRGRGLIQLTGRDAYRAYGQRLNLDLERNPDLALRLDVAAGIAGAFWDNKRLPGDPRSLNQMADAGDMETVTLAINGGENGLPDRLDRYRRVIGALREQAAALAAQEQIVHPPVAVQRLFINGVEALPFEALLLEGTVTTASGTHPIVKRSQVGEKLYVTTG
ncbi:glycoside hydrolase family 19 protein [Deinococcus apachensis]|uniref:glycoside hydrolase family 19 protein n=1 Tax=Deinococcus apachensis TaxID=309886 RepID=UPI0003629588|nr:glycoside hydrolase family 19 protein [Deinococcus apachensis]